MMLKKLFLIVLVFAFLAPTNVFAQTKSGQWSFTPYLGAVAATSRDVLEFDSVSTVTTVAFTFSDGSTFTGGGTATTTGDISLNDSHDTPILTGFDVAYGLSDTLEVFGGFEYVTAGSNKVNLLTVTGAFTFTDSAGTATVFAVDDTIDAEADSYNSWAIKFGATKYFPMGDYTPYVGGYGGFKHIDSMDVTLTTSVAGSGSTKVKYLDSTSTGMFGFHTGVNTNVTMGGTPVSLGVRARLDYSGDFNDDDTDLGSGIGTNINDTGSGVDFGLTAQVTIPF